MGAVTSGGMKKEEENLCQTKMFPIELTKRLDWQQRTPTKRVAMNGASGATLLCAVWGLRRKGHLPHGPKSRTGKRGSPKRATRSRDRRGLLAPYFSMETRRTKSAECVSSSYLQVFLGALTPDEMKKREREREKRSKWDV